MHRSRCWTGLEAERRLAESELQATQEAQAQAALELRRALAQLALRRVTSALNHIVIDRLMHRGDLSDAGSGRRPVLKLASIDPLQVDRVLPATLFGRVHIGQSAVVVPAVGGARLVATVRQIEIGRAHV